MSRRASSFRSKRLQNKKHKNRLYKYGFIALACVLVLLGACFLTRARFVAIDDVRIFGNQIAKKEVIEEIVKSKLDKNYFKIFSRNNFLLYPGKEVEKEIMGRFSSISEVSVSFDGLKKILVSIREYEQAYLWCDSETRDRCYFMNPRGYIFSESADFSSNVLFSYYGFVEDSMPIGKTYMEEQSFNELNNFIDNVRTLNIQPVGLIARSEGDFELLLSSGGSILFSNRESFLATFENIQTIITEQTKIKKDFMSKLDYIDVRFSSKAFVKVR